MKILFQTAEVTHENNVVYATLPHIKVHTYYYEE